MEFKLIDEREQEDSISIQLIDKKKILGHIDISEIVDGYWWFDNDKMTEEQFDNLFPDSNFLLIQLLFINEKFRGKGFARILMEEFEKLIPKIFKHHNRIILSASPICFPIANRFDLEQLILFYKKFGFQELEREINNCTMIKNI